jgi:hypothetical protein
MSKPKELTAEELAEQVDWAGRPEPLPPSFVREIHRALDFERSLLYKGILALAIVAVVVVLRSLFFA